MIKNIALFIMFVLLCVAAWWIFSNPPKPESPIVTAAKESVKVDVERVTKNVDSLGREHAIAQETNHYISQAGLKASTDSTLIRTVDSLTRLLGIERRQFRSYVQAQTEVVDSLMRATRTPTGYAYNDKWVSLALKQPTATDSAMFSFSYNAEVNMAQYWKRRWLLAPKRPYLDIWLSDPRAKINGVKRLVIEPDPKRFGLTVMAVGEYYGGDAMIGGGVSVDIGRFRVQGNYLYDGEQWQPAIRTGFKLVDW